MSHEVAKLLLEKAGTFLERTEAIKAALQLGMPLHEIEEYLDWLDTMGSCGKPNGQLRGTEGDDANNGPSNAPDE